MDGETLGLGEAVGAHVAASHGPLVVLLGEDRTNEADDRVAAVFATSWR